MTYIAATPLNGGSTISKVKDDDEIVRDGQKVVVPLHLMDEQQRFVASMQAAPVALHRPGQAVQSDADKQRRGALYDAYDQRVGSAWKNPKCVIDAVVKSDPVSSTAAGGDLYTVYDKRLSERWKGAA
jgi:hypothetical protein